MTEEVKPGYKRTEIGVIPEDWNHSILSEVCVTSSGTTPARSQFDRYFRNGQINWVKTLDLNNKKILRTDEQVTPDALAETSLREYPAKTVLIAMYGGFNQIGRTGILGIPACVNQAITAIQCGTQLIPEYLLATLNFRVEHWKAVASSSRKDPNITSQDVRDFRIAYPTIKEQEKISEALSCIDALIRSMDELIAKKRDIQQATIQQLLTGQRRLPGFSEEWEVKRLGEIGTFMKGSGVTRDQSSSGLLPCVRYGEIYTAHHNLVRAFQSLISKEVAASATLLKMGDLLFAGSGETKAEIGKCVAFVNNFEAYAGGDIVILRPISSDSTFLGYALNTQEICRQKACRGQGDAVVHISANALSTVEIKLPPKDEQTAIATTLSDMGAELAALEARRDKALQLKQGMMQELLTGRIRLTNQGV